MQKLLFCIISFRMWLNKKVYILHGAEYIRHVLSQEIIITRHRWDFNLDVDFMSF